MKKLITGLLVTVLAAVLAFSFVACSTPTSSGGESPKSLMDGTWRRGNLTHYYQIRIAGSNWEYSEGAAGHIVAYSNGTWVSSKDTITAGSNGIITLTTDQVYQNGTWQTYPEEDYNLKTNAAAYTVSADGSSLKIDEAILTTAGIWGTLEGDYEKQYEWGGWANANGSSTINLSDASGTFAMSGNIASGDDHWAGMGMFPTDTATQNAMKTAKSISFDVKGSGEYELILMTSDIQRYGEQTGDYTWYKRIFTAPAAETTITLNIEDFLQDGTYMEFKQNLWEGIQFAPVWESKGAFNLTFGNVKVSDTADGMTFPDWRWDSNTSDSGTIDLTETDGTVTINGNNSGGFVDWWAMPNNGKTSHALKNATTLSFTADGTGMFEIRLRTPWGDDHSEVYRQFTLSGTEETITLNISDFTSDTNWGPFDQRQTVNIQFSPIGNGTFSLTMSDLKMTGVRTPVTEWHGLKLPKETKGLQYDTYDGKTDVLYIEPTNGKYGENVLEYSLNSYVGKRVKIELSMDVKLVSDAKLLWLTHEDGWPNVAGSRASWKYSSGTWHTIKGNYTSDVLKKNEWENWLCLTNDLDNAALYIANLSLTITEYKAGDPLDILLLGNDAFWECEYRPSTLLNGYRIQSGDTFVFSYSFTSDAAIDNLRIWFVDQGPDTGGKNQWQWVVISNAVTVQAPVVAGTVYTGTATITANKTATGTSPLCNRLLIAATNKTTPQPMLTFTQFELTKGTVPPPPVGNPVTTWKGLTAPSATKALQYTTYDGKSDVLHIEPNTQYGYSALEYDLSAYDGKKIKVDVSMDMKLESPAIIVWSINTDGTDSYPMVAGSYNQASAGTWNTISGGYVLVNTLQGAKTFYLNGYDLSNPRLQNASAYIANFTITVTEIPAGETWISLQSDNNGWMRTYQPASLLNGTKITDGDTFTFSYSFTSDVAIDQLRVCLVDNGKNTGGTDNYGWVDLSNQITVQSPVAAGTVYTGTVTIDATATATDATPEANRLAFWAGNGTASAPTLKFTTLTLTKN